MFKISLIRKCHIFSCDRVTILPFGFGIKGIDHPRTIGVHLDTFRHKTVKAKRLIGRAFHKAFKHDVSNASRR